MSRLPIVADAPCVDPRLGFEAYAAALAAAIRGGTPAQFTVGIYGAWGSGKSSLLNAIERMLRGDSRVIAVPFDAWRYERAPHIIVPLLHRIDTALRSHADEPLKQRVRKALLSVVRSLSLTAGPVTFDPARALDAAADVRVLDAAFDQPYEDMRAISEALGDRRVVVLIDDLDRCSPANVVAVLEAINLVMDVPGFVFVLALDYEVLVQAVTAKYPHASGHVFIEKMVQVPFRVPRLVLDEHFLDALVPGWEAWTAELPTGFDAIAYDVATLGLAGNPRQIKRFINTVLVLSRVALERGAAVTVRDLAAVVGLQLRWPAEYQDFADAVFAGDEDPTGTLRRSEDTDLARYVARLFDEAVSAAALQGVLQLTQAAAPPEEASGYDTGDYDTPPAAVSGTRRERNLARVIDALREHGYQRRGGTKGYYHDAVPGVRVVVGKTVVRIEAKERDTGRWLLGFSGSITQQSEDILRLVAEPAEMAWAVRAELATRMSSDYDMSQFR
ncbi:MAG TPA: P-loop NTPase fold protein [Frankiaceae bacterium]|nr:P-loop NTPase fold protein [Frankiaceae bacterium]